MCGWIRTGLWLTLLFIAVLTEPVHAGERRSRLWKVSLFVVGAASAADTVSSYGHLEANPLLRRGSRFGPWQAVGKNTALLSLLPQRKLRQGERVMAAGNFATAAVYTVVAVRNWRMPPTAVKPGLNRDGMKGLE